MHKCSVYAMVILIKLITANASPWDVYNSIANGHYVVFLLYAVYVLTNKIFEILLSKCRLLQ